MVLGAHMSRQVPQSTTICFNKMCGTMLCFYRKVDIAIAVNLPGTVGIDGKQSEA